jgi:alpha-galactosidase
MRMIPAIVDISRDIQRLCPSAKFFNFTNPMAIVCRALQKVTSVPVVGLCDGVPYSQDYLAMFAGVDKKRVTSYNVGLNHLSFIYDFRIDGQDALPVLKDRLKRARGKGIDFTSVGCRFTEKDNHELLIEAPFSWELFEAYGAFPAAGEMHVVEFYAERFSGHKCYYGKTLGVDAFSFEQTIARGEKRFEDMKLLADSTGELPAGYFESFSSEHEKLLSIIHSIENDARTVFSVNVPNNGAVRNLPFDSVLEMPAAASAKGLLPLQLNDFPDTVAAISARHAAIVEIAADAALKGSRDLFAEAVLMGGYINNKDSVMSMVEELLKVQAKYLPQY